MIYRMEDKERELKLLQKRLEALERLKELENELQSLETGAAVHKEKELAVKQADEEYTQINKEGSVNIFV